MTKSTARPCLRCGTLGGYIPRDCHRPTRQRNLCKRCYDAEWYHGNLGHWPAMFAYDAHPETPVGIITLASRGIRNDTPPTDPALTPAQVWDVGNTNAWRATEWLRAHGHTDLATLVTTIWEPATTDTERKAA